MRNCTVAGNLDPQVVTHCDHCTYAGEAPHGKYHVLHGDWRLWYPLLMRMAAVVNNKFVKKDPIVSEFNEHEHFLRIVIEAFAEYVVEISATGGDYHDSDYFLRMAERNLSFAYICYFLFLFGFKYVQMRKAIRENDSKTLDLIWRENLSSARTELANKTQYSQMTVSLIYWGTALREPLQTAFHNTRTIRWVKTHVGWDMPVEMLNMWIKESVVSHVTESQIKKFIRRVNFTQRVKRQLEEVQHRFRKDDSEHLKYIETDKEIIKQFLREKIGTTFDECTAETDENVLEVDVKDWGGNRRGAMRNHAPWRQMQRAMEDYRQYVRKHLGKLCPWHHWM